MSEYIFNLINAFSGVILGWFLSYITTCITRREENKNIQYKRKLTIVQDLLIYKENLSSIEFIGVSFNSI